MSHSDRDDDGKGTRRPSGTPLMADRLPALPPPRPIVALRVIDNTVELKLALSGTKRTITLGSAKAPTVDLTLKADGVSRTHLKVQAQGSQLEVIDAGSKNGTYFGPIGHDEREAQKCVSAGDIFRVASTHIIALDTPLIELRPHMQRSIGYDAHRAVHVALSTAAGTKPLALVGPNGCDHAALARQIHNASKRSAGPFINVERRDKTGDVLDRAWGGTVFLDLAEVPRPPASFVEDVLDPRAYVRLIVAAPKWRPVEIALEDHARVLGSSRIKLVPLSERRADVPAIFNDLFISELNSHRKVEELGALNVEALMAHDWRDNVLGIRRVLDKVHARIVSENTSAAADLLGISRQTLTAALKNLGLVFDADVPRRARR